MGDQTASIFQIWRRPMLTPSVNDRGNYYVMPKKKMRFMSSIGVQRAVDCHQPDGIFAELNPIKWFK